MTKPRRPGLAAVIREQQRAIVIRQRNVEPVLRCLQVSERKRRSRSCQSWRHESDSRSGAARTRCMAERLSMLTRSAYHGRRRKWLLLRLGLGDRADRLRRVLANHLEHLAGLRVEDVR